MSADITVEYLRANIARLLPLIGDEGECKGCSARIWWVRHKNGKVAPYTDTGLNHFADCKVANRFKSSSKENGK